VLSAEYATPDTGLADLENVLLYNVGSGAYSHLVRVGLTARRTRSPDELHRVSYTVTEPADVTASHGETLATVQLREPVRGEKPLPWWIAFRIHLLTLLDPPFVGQVAVDVELGRNWHGPGLAAVVKPLLDGLVSALHVHDGSNREHITAVLSAGDNGQSLWLLLNDPTKAILGERRLIRPHGARLAWNPADELCAQFSVIRGNNEHAVTATVFGIP
jgi:hypothetical protein